MEIDRATEVLKATREAGDETETVAGVELVGP
jgi:hypothetical protein